MLIPRPTLTCLATIGVLAASLALADAPALAVGPQRPLTQAATGVTATTATLNGTLNPKNKAKAGWHFAYSIEAPCTGETTTPEEPEVLVKAQPEHAEVTELIPNTTYTFCLVATSKLGETTGSELTFTTIGVKPLVDRESAPGVTAFDARLQAHINPENQETQYHFEYATNEAFSEAVTVAGGTLPAGMEEQLAGPVDLGGGLQPNTTYYYRAVAQNGTGVTQGATQSFTTIGMPAVQTGAALSPTSTTAQLSGTIDPEGGETTYSFLYVDQTGYEAAKAESASDLYVKGRSTVSAKLGASREAQAVAPITAEELRPETTYHYALLATNAAGTKIGLDGTFTTAPATAPLVVTMAAVEVTQTAAVMVGALDTRGLQTSYEFELASEAESYLPQGFASAGTAAGTQTVSRRLNDLAPGIAYHYRLCATNQDGRTCGSSQTFATPSVPNPLTLPGTQPLLALAPVPVTGAGRVLGTKTTKPLTNAQKLSRALKACRKKPRRQRAGCEKLARRRYGKGKPR
jgi:hypothetical protein